MELENNENQVPSYYNYQQQQSNSLFEIKPLSENNGFNQFDANSIFKFPSFQQSINQQPLLFLNQESLPTQCLFSNNSMGLQTQNSLFSQVLVQQQPSSNLFFNQPAKPQIQITPQNADEDISDGDYHPEDGNGSDTDEEEYMEEDEMVEGISIY